MTLSLFHFGQFWQGVEKIFHIFLVGNPLKKQSLVLEGEKENGKIMLKSETERSTFE